MARVTPSSHRSAIDFILTRTAGTSVVPVFPQHLKGHREVRVIHSSQRRKAGTRKLQDLSTEDSRRIEAMSGVLLDRNAKP